MTKIKLVKVYGNYRLKELQGKAAVFVPGNPEPLRVGDELLAKEVDALCDVRDYQVTTFAH